jgi:GntP family gluconate:H+ symporter
VIAGISGYLLAVLITCCITAYILLNPILNSFEKDPKRRNVLLYLAAVGSIISYALIYPTPVVIPLFDAFSGGMSPLVFDAISIPLSLVALAGILIFLRWWRQPDSSSCLRLKRSGPLAGMGPLHCNRGIHPDCTLRP